MNPDITKLNVTELKALAFDQVTLLQQTQQNIQVLNAEITKRSQAVKPDVVPETEDKQ